MSFIDLLEISLNFSKLCFCQQLKAIEKDLFFICQQICNIFLSVLEAASV